ncbi:MAG: hypothetical protein IKO93_02655 [Lentisphaeria bacterium]|nr:hypothetical protein [Lentisphaeria bacterium]
MSFQLKIWDHCRYVKNRGKPYDEMARHLETMAGAGMSACVIYMPEVISLDDYCRAAEQTGMAVEARISPAWGVKDPVRRTLPEKDLQEMEKRFGIRLSGICGSHPHNRTAFLASAGALAERFAGRIQAIHLDFIRNDNALLMMDYPCQCDACQALYRRYFNCTVPTREMLREPAVQYKLLAIRNDNIRKTVCAMRELTSRHGLRLTMAARANYLNSRDITDPPVWGLGPAVLEGQDWVAWNDEGLLDGIYTMNYHTDPELFRSVLGDHLRLTAEHRDRLWSGIGISSSMGEISPSGAAQRLELVRAAGLPGAVFFNKTNLYSEEFLAVFRQFAC